jgi:DNA-binding NarL/FixJ family response regulator
LFCYDTVMRGDQIIKIGVLEDDIAFRDYLLRVLREDERMVLLFTESHVAAAIEQLHAAAPDVLLVDMQLPDGSGLDLVSAASRVAPQCKIIMLTILFDRRSVLDAIERGAHGYLLKDTAPALVRSGIHDVLADHAPVSPAAAAHLLATMQRTRPDPSAAPTPREREILECIAKGLSYAEVATALGISAYTVGDHIKAIYRKLAVNSKTEAIFEGRQKGWLSLID